MSFEGTKGRFSIKNAVKHGVITGLMGWAAIEGVQAYQPNAHQIFAERGAHTQFYSGDVGFGTHTDRQNTVDVTYRGRSVAAIPSSSFGQPQSGGEHQARRSDRGSAQHMRTERTSEPLRAQAADNGAPSYVHIDSIPSVSAMVVAPVILESSTPVPIAQIPPWLPFVAMAPEAIYGVGTTLNKTLIHSGALQSRLNSFEALSLEARLLAACAVPLTAQAPTEIAPMTQTVAPEVTGTPLVNEVLTSTPVPRIEIPVGAGEYPSMVSVIDSPKVYSYGGPEGRENMDEITRAMFDRYIAELAREGKIQGSTPEALYLDFDKSFDFKMYVTDQMLTRIVQYKSGGAFLVPDNMVGQVYRELQLSYNDLFQGGAAVDVGTDNFSFREYQADRVGGVGAWPVFVNVDEQSIPISWLNMERGGAVTPLESSVAVVTPGATSVPQGAESPQPAVTEPGATRVVTENGHDYVYTYTKLGETKTGEELWRYVRETGTVILFDGPVRNYLPFQILGSQNVQNEQNFVSVNYTDQTDINSPNPWLTRTLSPELQKRYFAEDPRKGTMTDMEGSRVLQMEMLGLGEGDHKQAYLDIIVANGTPEGEVKRVKLSETTGIILTIMTAEDIAKLGGENVLELHAQEGDRNYTYYVQVYDVDEKGNELVRVAFADPLSEIPEAVLRKVLFSIPGNLIDHKDQREQGFTNVAQIFAQYSAKTNETTGKPDVEIELLPATPALTTPTTAPTP